MKKILLTGALCVMSMTAMAQKQVVKEAEKLMKSGATIEEVLKVITPAFSDASTKSNPQTYFIPGEAGFKTYDNFFGKKAFGQLNANDIILMGDNLLQGYDYMIKALPLDALPDEKGKVKKKYTNKIVDAIVGHYNDFNAAAIDFWGQQAYDKAYRAWDIMLNLPSIPEIVTPLVEKNKLFPDSIIGEIYYNQALAAWQMKDFDNALKAFMNAKDKGYDKENLYKYAVAVAQQGGKDAEVLALSKEALPKYGKNDPIYLNIIINDYLTRKDYDNAFSAINAAIEKDPNNSDYYIVLGIVYDNVIDLNASTPEAIADNKAKRQKAIEAFRKATELNPENANAYYQLGRELCEISYILSDEGPSENQQMNKYYEEVLKPVFQDAVVQLEKAYQLDNQNDSVLRYLENAYFNLRDEANVRRIHSLLGED